MALYPKLITDALEQVMYPGTKKNLIESEMLADDIRIDGNGEIMWLVGRRSSETYRIGSTTTTALRIRF